MIRGFHGGKPLGLAERVLIFALGLVVGFFQYGIESCELSHGAVSFIDD